MSSSSYRSLDMSPNPPIDAVTVSGATVYDTGPIKAIDFETFTFQAEWTGTPTGTFAVLGSLDGVNFRPFGVTIPMNPAGAPGGFVLPMYGHGMKWLKMTYTNSASTGVLTVSALGKTR